MTSIAIDSLCNGVNLELRHIMNRDIWNINPL